uniref:Uncharacterized protein n=1 Tax=Rhizophora mucronata TaxID=61149 RepID=A0A2P2NC94_RHIMU
MPWHVLLSKYKNGIWSHTKFCTMNGIMMEEEANLVLFKYVHLYTFGTLE